MLVIDRLPILSVLRATSWTPGSTPPSPSPLRPFPPPPPPPLRCPRSPPPKVALAPFPHPKIEPKPNHLSPRRPHVRVPTKPDHLDTGDKCSLSGIQGFWLLQGGIPLTFYTSILLFLFIHLHTSTHPTRKYPNAPRNHQTKSMVKPLWFYHPNHKPRKRASSCGAARDGYHRGLPHGP